MLTSKILMHTFYFVHLELLMKMLVYRESDLYKSEVKLKVPLIIFLAVLKVTLLAGQVVFVKSSIST